MGRLLEERVVVWHVLAHSSPLPRVRVDCKARCEGSARRVRFFASRWVRRFPVLFSVRPLLLAASEKGVQGGSRVRKSPLRLDSAVRQGFRSAFITPHALPQSTLLVLPQVDVGMGPSSCTAIK